MRRLVVDGYNLLHRVARYAAIADEDLEAARVAVVSDVASYAAGHLRATIVFDGAGNPGSSGAPHEIAGVEVVFSPFGVEADTVIERIARDAREAGEQVTVVTSDVTVQWTVARDRVDTLSADGFANELDESAGEWREHAASGPGSARLDDRIDPEVRAVLRRWAAGES